MGNEYVDLFATKGIEYLVVIGFLLTLILFWRFLNKPGRPENVGARPERPPRPVVEWFSLAEGFHFHPGHGWVAAEGDGIVRVGIDDFVQKLIGRPSEIRLPQVGSQLEQGDTGWRFTVDGRDVPVLSPISGQIVAVNNEVVAEPNLINQEPYERGWLLKVRVPRLQVGLKNLFTGALAHAWMAESALALRQRMSQSLGTVLQDGGVPVSGFARELAPETWDELVGEFLLTRD